MNHPWPNPPCVFSILHKFTISWTKRLLVTNLLLLGQNGFWSLPLFPFFGDRLHPHVKIQFSLYVLLWLSWSNWFPDQARDPKRMEGNFFLLHHCFLLCHRGLRELCPLLNHCSAMLPDSWPVTDRLLPLSWGVGGADKTLGFWGCFPAERLNLLPPLSPQWFITKGHSILMKAL